MGATAALSEKIRSFARCHDTDGKRLRHCAPVVVERGDDDMTGGGRQKVAHGLGIRRIVENQQPVASLPQRAAHGGDDDALIALILFRQRQRLCQRGKIARQRGDILRAQPPDNSIIGGMTERILDGDLRLAHATQTVNSLRQPRGFSGNQIFPNVFQHFNAPGEIRVAIVRHIPHRRQGTGKWRRLG